MNWINRYLWIVLVSLGYSCQQPSGESTKKKEGETSNRYLIEATELRPLISNDTLTILDLQHPEDYEKGHIFNSINLWRSALNDTSFKYDGMLPNKVFLEELLRSIGVPKDNFLVLYDNRGSCEATRLWWILKQYGYERMAILNGGLQGWSSTDSLSTITFAPGVSTFELPANQVASSSNILVTELESLIASSDQVLVLDTRSSDEFEGETLKNGALWAGNIPGSQHIDWMEAVDPKTYRFKEPDELQKIYNEVLNDDRMKVIYCHSGVRSTHTFFVLTELLGHKNVKNYDGSWVEWTNHFQPIAVN